MNSLKKGEEIPLLNFEVILRSQVPGSWYHFYTMPCFISYLRDVLTMTDFFALPPNF